MSKCAILDSACAGEILGATRTSLTQTDAGCFLRFQTQPPSLAVNKETSFTLAPPFFFAQKKKIGTENGQFARTVQAALSYHRCRQFGLVLNRRRSAARKLLRAMRGAINDSAL